ncbi:hypothetical protein GmHk_16G046685 [Glycine max]|nr:hypothetical protein GmHk_16G046685 [Glycine max]
MAIRMSRSHVSSSRWTSVNEELEHLVANMPKLTIEEHGEWKELANMMQHVVAPPEALFQTISARDQLVKYMPSSGNKNYHNVVYNQDLDQPAIVAGWTTLRDFYQLTGDHLVSLHHYGWTHLYLGNVAECQLVFNHWRKSLKIGAGWKHFYETLSFIADMEIVFEFIDPDVNCVLCWPCL